MRESQGGGIQKVQEEGFGEQAFPQAFPQVFTRFALTHTLRASGQETEVYGFQSLHHHPRADVLYFKKLAKDSAQHVYFSPLIIEMQPTYRTVHESEVYTQTGGWGGREVQERGVISLIHADAWQKHTQYCKAIVLQLKIDNFLKLKKSIHLNKHVIWIVLKSLKILTSAHTQRHI